VGVMGRRAGALLVSRVDWQPAAYRRRARAWE
jgi:hypothetical protein